MLVFDIENVPHFCMSALSDFHAQQLIMRHCMATEGTTDADYAMQIARLKDFIRNGTPTRAGRIVATLMQANEALANLKCDKSASA